ncbi:Ger(x)C family spore germination protein [Cytobacillus sp. FJAT-53684]|uniref:Ger(X)C family spore germination protein n=1 Tax=Cytobacillus mangrovibacter TaxID=3299024 RepID=A0ABW6JZD8_9BACI
MRKRWAFILTAFLILSTLTSCWSRKEVANLAIAVALGIDKQEGEYIVSVQIINPAETASSEKAGGYDTPVTTYTARGQMLVEGLRKLTKEIPRKVYLAHLRMIVIGEEIAKEGIYDALDFLSRDHEMRTDFYIIVAKEHTAVEILKVLTGIEKIPANKLFNSLEISTEEWAATGKIRLNELMDDIVSEGTQPTLTGVIIRGNPKEGMKKENVEMISSKTFLSYSGIAAFHKNKLVGWLNEDESKGFNYIKDNVHSTVVVFEMNDGDVAVEVIDCKTDIISQIKNGAPSFEVKITGEGNVADVNTKLDLMNPNVIGELEEKVNKDIKDVIQSSLNKAQKEYETDIFGFGEQIHKNEPKEWETIKKQWSDLFPEVPVNINVKIKIRRVGTISNPFHNELLEEK